MSKLIKIIKKIKCQKGFHKWVPLYIKGEYNNKMIKFIACYCKDCRKGYSEAHNINNIAKNSQFGTYSEKYFNEKSNKDN